MAERVPTVSSCVSRPAGERGLAEMYSDRVATGRAPASPRDHIIFGGPRANQQAGTKFAGGGFPYMFVIVVGLWAGWKAVLWLALHGISWKVVGGVLLLLCCTPMILQALWPDNEYEINLAATLQQHANGTLQDSIIDPRRATEDAGVPRNTDGTVQADVLLGKIVPPTYSPPALVVEGVTVGSFPAVAGGDLGLVGQPASPRLGLIVSSGVVSTSADLTLNGEILTGHQTETRDGNAHVSGSNDSGDGLVESL